MTGEPVSPSGLSADQLARLIQEGIPTGLGRYALPPKPRVQTSVTREQAARNRAALEAACAPSRAPKVSAARALTLRPPWSDCVAFAGARVANHPRPLAFRGLVLIHAALTVDAPARHSAAVTGALPSDHRLVRGAVVAVAELDGCHLDDGCCAPWGEQGQYHLCLTNVQALITPFACDGARSPWKPTPRLLAGIAQTSASAHGIIERFTRAGQVYQDRQALPSQERLALQLLSEGVRASVIALRTNVTAPQLYAIAAKYEVTAPCATSEGANCHLARGEEPCRRCRHAMRPAPRTSGGATRQAPATSSRRLRAV